MMKSTLRRGRAASLPLLAGLVAFALLQAARPYGPQDRQTFLDLFQQGNFAEAYDGLRDLLLADARGEGAAENLRVAIDCLRHLGRLGESDEFLEEVLAQPVAASALLSAAQQYLGLPHSGTIVDGAYRRNLRNAEGRAVNSSERDRLQALQLLEQARARWDELGRAGQDSLLRIYSSALRFQRQGPNAWQLQELTALDTLPDYFDGFWYFPPARGAAVNEAGDPVLHQEPTHWEAASTDGERWRQVLADERKLSEPARHRADWNWAQFLHEQFGVQTVGTRGLPVDGASTEDPARSVHTLEDHEALARMANGTRRFSLADEYHFIAACRRIIAEEGHAHRRQAHELLATVFENRRQYPKAAEQWDRAGRHDRRDQILGNWGTFETTLAQPAGRGATLDFRFRNGSAVTFVAHRIELDKVLDMLKEEMRGEPNRLDWSRANLSRVGYRIVTNNERELLGDQVASWTLPLQPLEGHEDRIVTVTTPLQEGGAYLLKSTMKDGNSSHVVVWLSSLALIRKQLHSGVYYYVADAETGAPVAGAAVDLFGYRWLREGRRSRLVVEERQGVCDSKGQFFFGPEKLPEGYQWLATARTERGQFAYEGFTGIWTARNIGLYPTGTQIQFITDRPLYRPGQSVQFQAWLRQPRYDGEEPSREGQLCDVEILDPRGDTIYKETLACDEFGAIGGALDLPADAVLGQYFVRLPGSRAHFRVEEYKKPEFEVLIQAPEEPVRLGETFSATVEARYFWGEPVTKAKVKVRVERRRNEQRWFPPCRWDWLYGSGYSWQFPEYRWYPGFGNWGCLAPLPWWQSAPHDPPEVVLDNDFDIGPDGTVQVEIDSSTAQAFDAGSDHAYRITAEVVDASRRQVVGQGQVLATRRPFQVFVSPNRGFYRVGDPIEVTVHARTADGRSVGGTGRLVLARIRYDEAGDPSETEVGQWDLALSGEQPLRHTLKATSAGQFRLSCKVTDVEGREQEGAVILSIRGGPPQDEKFIFDDLELIAENAEVQPGESLRLLVQTRRPDSTVLLFVRPASGFYPVPELLRLDGQSREVVVEVDAGDCPNFFVEAITVAGGKVYSRARQIVVPPEEKIVQVEALPGQPSYGPGDTASVQLKVTDGAGEPLSGALVLTVYDRALEAISGGSNVADIRSKFWGWRRNHNPRTQTNLGRSFGPLLEPDSISMRPLGLFAGMQDFSRGAAQKLGRRREAEGFAAPASDMVAGEQLRALGYVDDGRAGSGGGAAQAPLVEPVVRSEFADTACFRADLRADAQGLVRVDFKMPDNLTSWKVRTWYMGPDCEVGMAEGEILCRKDLLVRPQTPRFLIERDEVVLSANIHNYLDEEVAAEVQLELLGGCLQLAGAPAHRVELRAGGEARVDWRAKVVREGEAVVRVSARTRIESDAAELRLPVYVHGMEKTESFSGVVARGELSSQLQLRVPEQRRVEQSHLEVRYSPSLAAAMVDALPYLVDYPYGCTEQTLNRFLPTVLTQKVLLTLGLDLEDIRNKRTNLNSQEIGDDAERARDWQRTLGRNPVFDEIEVERMVAQGLADLAEMQLTDGGWGWFSGYGERSSVHTTAGVVHGLLVARELDVAVDAEMLARGVRWLQRYLDQELVKLRNAEDKVKPYKHHCSNADALAFWVLVEAGPQAAAADRAAGHPQILEYLYRDRVQLSVYSKVLLALASLDLGATEKLAMLRRNVEQFLQEDAENQTAALRWQNASSWYLWHGSFVEANAFYLKLLARLEPKSSRCAAVAKYLVQQRRHGSYWDSTRDTAYCIEALASFVSASGEIQSTCTVELELDGELRKRVTIQPENLFTYDHRFLLSGAELRGGEHQLVVRRTGEGPLYFNAYLTYFSLEDHLSKAGLEIKVERKYFRLREQLQETTVADGRAQVERYQTRKFVREPLGEGAELTSGDLLEVELVVETKNDYEYILLEDRKAAGLEPVSLQSGYLPGSMRAYVEYRDDRVAVFLARLPQGKHSLSYRLRAEVPGTFHALPTFAQAMYAPELRANSDENRLHIKDSE